MQKILPLGLSYDDVLLIPRYSELDSRLEVDLTTKLTKKITLKLPLTSTNMNDVTGVKMAIALGKQGALGILPRFTTPEAEADEVGKVKKAGVLVGASVGCKEDSLSRTEMLLKAGADLIVLDVAHGHMKKVVYTTFALKSKFGRHIDLVVGNIATKEGADLLFEAGADCVKVGVGPGSICTTRIETGSGVPQFTAVADCAKSARKFKKTLIADGGTKSGGDIVKGLAAGASAIMTGNQFAGTDEASGKLVFKNGKKWKTYNASTSYTEKMNHLKMGGNGLSKNYVKQIEGVESFVPLKGSVNSILEKLSASMRSGFSYSGARNINELWARARFIQITNFGRRESEAHDVSLASKIL